MAQYLIYKAGQFIALHLPLWFSYLLADMLSTLNFLLMRTDRINVIKNLKIIFPEKRNLELSLIAWKVVRNFGKYLVVFFRTNEITRDFIDKNVELDGINHLQDAFGLNKGVILLTAHLGNWELAGIILGRLGYKLTAVAMPHKDKSVNDFFNGRRQSANIKVVPLGNAVRECLKALHNGEAIALLGDRDFTQTGFKIDFFDKPALIPRGPALLSLKTGSPIVPAFLILIKKGKFRLQFEPPIMPHRSGNETTDAEKLSAKYINVIENYVKKFPEQWYMFRPFWCQ